MTEQEGSLEDEVLGLARGDASGSMEDEVLQLAKCFAQDQIFDKPQVVPDGYSVAELSEKADACFKLAFDLAGEQTLAEKRWTERMDMCVTFLNFHAEPYSDIAVAQAESGNLDGAKETLAFAMSELDKPYNTYSATNYEDLAISNARIGLHDEAKEIISNQLVIPSNQAQGYAKIAYVYAEQGLCDRAIEAIQIALEQASQIKPFPMPEDTPAEHVRINSEMNNNLKAQTYREIAITKAKLGLHEEALSLVDKFEDDSHFPLKLEFYLAIASEEAKSKRLDQAKETIDLALGLDRKNYSRIIYTCIGAGMYYKALEISQKARNASEPFDFEDSSTMETVRFFVKTGFDRPVVASALAHNGLYDEAFKVAETAQPERASAYSGIVSAYLEDGEYQKAIETAESIEFPEPDELQKVVEEPEAIKKKREQTERYRSFAFKDIAVAQANAGLFEDAIVSASKIEHEYAQSQTYLSIASAQAKAGIINEAMQTADKIKDNGDKTTAYTNIFSSCHNIIKKLEAA